jgi:hypothetical protein
LECVEHTSLGSISSGEQLLNWILALGNRSKELAASGTSPVIRIHRSVFIVAASLMYGSGEASVEV